MPPRPRTAFVDAYFNQNYVGATNNGIIRGAYHFAHPDSSSGAAQANYFLAHGGGWSRDGITLPGALDLEGIILHARGGYYILGLFAFLTRRLSI